MKTLVVLAVCVAVAMSSPCSDQCNGACNIAKTGCDATVVMGPLCGVAYGSCLMGCSNICGCVDGCDATCAPAKETCETAATNVISKAQCIVENDACIVDCQSICGLQKVDETVMGLVQQGLGGIM